MHFTDDFSGVVSEINKNKGGQTSCLLMGYVEHSQSEGLCGLPSVDCPPKPKTSA